MAQVKRASSIEKEPRTLKIDFAREAAMYVVNTRSVEEAMRIFLEGLEPVVSCGRDEDTVKRSNAQPIQSILQISGI